MELYVRCIRETSLKTIIVNYAYLFYLKSNFKQLLSHVKNWLSNRKKYAKKSVNNDLEAFVYM